MENKPKFSITRSFTRKINLGNYESADFFASATYNFEEEPSEAERLDKSKELIDFCGKEVQKDVKRLNLKSKGTLKYHGKK